MNEALVDNKTDLAVALRAADYWGLNEGICNHFSLRGTSDGKDGVWIHPKHVLWSRIKPSDMVFLSHQECESYRRSNTCPDHIEATAFFIHAAITEKFDGTNAILHTHMPYATALACLADTPPLTFHQNFARFYQRLSILDTYDGLIISEEEAKSLANQIHTDNGIVLMPNHGALSLGSSIATAFDDLYYFERACQLLVNCLSTGQAIAPIDEQVFEKTAAQFNKEREPQAELFFSELRSTFLSVIDKEF